jgi:hypothetical protein
MKADRVVYLLPEPLGEQRRYPLGVSDRLQGSCSQAPRSFHVQDRGGDQVRRFIRIDGRWWGQRE